MTQQQAIERWGRRHPTFDMHAYRHWVEAHGYYRSALDVNKPEFYEYAEKFLQQYECDASDLAIA